MTPDKKTRLINAAAVSLAVAIPVAASAAFLYYHTDFLSFYQHLGNQFINLAWFALLAAAAFFVGRLVGRGIFRIPAASWEAKWAAGFAVLGLVALALGAVGILYAWFVKAVTAALLVAAAFALVRELKRRRPGEATASPPERGVWILLALSAPFVVVFLTRAFMPPVDWDALTYHLYIPKVYVRDHHLTYLPRLAYASMPLGANMMFTWAYGWGGLDAARLVAPFFTVLLLAATWRFARRFMSRFWAAASVILLVATPSVAYFLPVTNVDLILAAFVVMAACVVWGDVDGRRAAWAGLLLGLAMSVKYTGVYAAVAFAPVIVAYLITKRWTWRQAVVFTGFAALPFVPWLIKAWAERGNPVFPACYNIWGGRDLSPVVAAALVHWQRGIGMGREWLDYLLLPWRVSFESGATYGRFDGAVLPWALLSWILAWLWFREKRLLVFTAAYFGAWAVLGSQQLRFLSAFHVATAVITAGVLAALVDRVDARTRAWVRAAALTPVFLFAYIVNTSCYPLATGAWSYILTGDRERVLVEASSYGATKVINEELPPDAVVLMIFDNQLLYLERRAVYDSFFEASETLLTVEKMETPAEVARYVQGLGATYILVRTRNYDYCWGFYEPAARALWERYLTTYATPFASGPDFQLWAVKNVTNGSSER